jgi:hypothetical protein
MLPVGPEQDALRIKDDVRRVHKERMIQNGMFIPRDWLGLVTRACQKFSGTGFEIVVLDDGLKRHDDMVKIRVENLKTSHDYDNFWTKVWELRNAKG